MSRIKKLFKKICHVDPVSDNEIESQNNINMTDAIAALREQLSGGEEMGLPSQDGVVLNPADPMSPSNLANGEGFKPVDLAGVAGSPMPVISASSDEYLCIVEDTAIIKNRNDDNSDEIAITKSSKGPLWKIYCPESILNNSNYTGPLYGYILKESFYVLILDHPLYQNDNLIIGFIEADDYPYAEHSSNKYFLSGKYEDSQLVLYLLYDNTHFSGFRPQPSVSFGSEGPPDYSIFMMARLLDDFRRCICYSTELHSYQELKRKLNLIEELNEWHVSIPESIYENIKFNGAIFGSHQDKTKKIFIYDTISFPDKIDYSKRIGYILNSEATTADKIALLQCDGNDIICGEIIDSSLKLSILPETYVLPDGKCYTAIDPPSVMISIRKTCDTVSDEDEEELQFWGEA